MTAPKLTEAQREALVRLSKSLDGRGRINQRPAHRLRVMGLVEVVTEHFKLGSRAKLYQLTDAGRAALKEGGK